MGRAPRLSLLLLATASLVAVTIDYALRELSGPTGRTAQGGEPEATAVVVAVAEPVMEVEPVVEVEPGLEPSPIFPE